MPAKNCLSLSKKKNLQQAIKEGKTYKKIAEFIVKEDVL